MKYKKSSPEWQNIIAKSAHWFSPNAMKFFGSRIHWNTLTPMGEDWLFISEEDNFNKTERFYSIRKATNEDGVTDTLAFQETANFAAIKEALRQIIIGHELASQHPECNTPNH